VSWSLLCLRPPSSTGPPSFQTPPATPASSLSRLSMPTLMHLRRRHTSQTPYTNWLSTPTPAKVPPSGSFPLSKR
jgi:hypothetical protein